MARSWNNLEWPHILMHAGLTVFICALGAHFQKDWVFVANAFFWFGREWGQHYEWPELLRLIHRPQVIMEWGVPAVLTWGIWYLFT